MWLNKMGSFFDRQLVHVVVCLLLVSCDTSAKTFPVHWNISNPIFRIDNTDNIFDVNVGNTPQEYDQANILCPYYSKDDVNASSIVDKEEYIIYSVNRDEYETCHISNPNPRIVAECRLPNRQLFFTITFRTFTPSPGGMEFRPGQDYYFISTSGPGDVHRRSGGRCATHNMKVVFKVKEKKVHREEPPAAVPPTVTSAETPHHRKHARPPTPPPAAPLPAEHINDNLIDVDSRRSKISLVTQDSARTYSHALSSPSPNLDPSYYTPIRPGPAEPEPNAKRRPEENDLFNSFRRPKGRSEEGVKQEASRMASNSEPASILTQNYHIVFLTWSVLILLHAA